MMFKAALVFVVLSFHIFNVAILPSVTLSNIALAITLLALFARLGYAGNIFNLPNIYRLSFSITVFVFLFLLPFLDILTYIYGGGAFENFIRSTVSWLGLGFSIIFGKVFHRQVLSKPIIIGIGIIAILFSLFVVFLSMQVSFDPEATRIVTQKYLPLGINGFLFSAFFAQAGVLSLIPRIKFLTLEYNLLVFLFTCLLLVGLILGSRQYLLSVAVLLVLWVLKSRFHVKHVAISSLIVFFAALPFLSVIVDSLTERYMLSVSRLDTEKYDLRWINALELEQFLYNNIFGMGFKFSSNYLDRAVDIGHLEMFIDHGPVKYVIFLFAILLILRCIAKYISLLRSMHVVSDINYLFYACIISFVWYGLFNEILFEYFVYIFIGALIGGSDCKMNIANINKRMRGSFEQPLFERQ